jgi:predicted TIM-barrel fold metal-dependent hydrolase
MKHIAPLYSTSYDPLWALCQELGVVVNTHSGGAGMPDYGRHKAAGQVWIAEATFFARRPLSHMLIGGVFDRFPGLKFVVTESGCSWIPGTLAQLDGFYDQIRTTGRIGELKYEPDEVPARRPSEYFSENCWVGMSFPSPGEAATRHELGTDRIMWGSDYPHDESTFPNTREGLRRAFAGADRAERELMLAGNAAAVYGFDLSSLADLASQWGPTEDELNVPYAGIPEGNRSPAFVRA